jgi:phage protein D
MNIKLTWNHKDVSQDLIPFVSEITITESAENGSKDELSIKLINNDQRFLNEWFPVEGHKINLVLNNIPFGDFSIDSMVFSIQPSTLTIKALSYTSLKRSVLTSKINIAYENLSLRSLISTIFQDTGYQSYIQCPDTHIDRFDITNESREQSLLKLANRYNARFCVKGDTLIFTNRFVQTNQKIDRLDVTGSISTKPRNSVAAVQIQYYDAQTQKNIQYREGDSQATGDAVMVIHGIAKTIEEARTRCQAFLKKNKNTKIAADFDIIGTPIAAGTIIQLTNFGKLNGTYAVNTVCHNINESGWRTRLKLTPQGA